MGYYLALPVLMILASLQSSIMPHFRNLSGQPDLVLLLIIVWAVHAPLEEALFWAFVGGLMQDLLSILPMGTSVMAPVLIIFALHGLRGQVYRTNLLFVIGFVIAGILLKQGVIFVVLHLIGNGYDVFDVARYVTLPELFMTLLLLLPVYLVVRLIQRRIYPPVLAHETIR
jgi:rod shape-determining protein MreD